METELITGWIATWALVGAFATIITPRFEWKSQLTRRLYIFTLGPFVWFVWGMVLIGDKLGVPREYWKR